MRLLKKNDPEMKILQKSLSPLFKMLEKTFSDLGRQHGSDAVDMAYASLLATTVYNQSISILRMPQQGDRGQHQQVIMAEFSRHRQITENAIALGFSNSMAEHVGKPIEYFCQIMVEPEAVNKEPC